MREIGARALGDFMEVDARLNAIALGLRELYSITDSSEAELKEDLENRKKSRSRIEGAVVWLRKASNALARAKMDEEGTIVRLTIDPPELLKKLTSGHSVLFPADLIAKMKRAQLSGLSATAEYAADGWIDLEVTSPQQKVKSPDITLSEVTTRLGRVSSAASLNVRDIAGTRPIINRSPVGNWKLQALRHYNGDSVKRLDLRLKR